MTARPPLVLGSDGLPQQLQSADTLAAGTTTLSTTSASIALSGGAILKAGQVTSTSAGVATITFPTPFPTACISVVATIATGGAVTNANYSVNVASYSKTGFTLQVDILTTTLLVLNGTGGIASTVLWQAIGY